MPILMDKKVGETPLQCLDRLRVEQNLDFAVPLTYAGRLDPVADGVLLVLVGEECKHKEDFLGLDKEYVCEIMWGVSTDTYDILGKIRSTGENIDLKKLPELLKKFVGKQQQKFPPYSSKPVAGKPLHEWAREDRLDEIEIPSKEIEIKSVELLETKILSVKEISENIFNRLAVVHGDFRQEEIIADWKKYFDEISQLFVSRISVTCSTGTYIRGLVHELGQDLDIGATVLSLRRIRVGNYKII